MGLQIHCVRRTPGTISDRYVLWPFCFPSFLFPEILCDLGAVTSLNFVKIKAGTLSLPLTPCVSIALEDNIVDSLSVEWPDRPKQSIVLLGCVSVLFVQKI